jgi:hypothetical protein
MVGEELGSVSWITRLPPVEDGLGLVAFLPFTQFWVLFSTYSWDGPDATLNTGSP